MLFLNIFSIKTIELFENKGAYRDLRKEAKA